MNSGKTAAHATYAWQQLNLTIPQGNGCSALACTDNKDNLYAGYSLIPPGNAAITATVASWDETSATWALLKSDFNNSINCMCTDSKGNLYVAGAFTDADGCCYVACYNAKQKQWSSLTNTAVKFPVTSICADSSGNIYITGNFRNANGNCYVAVFNKAAGSWSEISGGGFGQADTLELCYGAGNLFVLFNTTTIQGNSSGLKVWNKSSASWTTLTDVSINSQTLTLYYNDGDVYILNPDGTVCFYNLTSATWSHTTAMSTTSIPLGCLCFDENNLMYAAGCDSTYAKNFLNVYEATTQNWTPLSSSLFPTGAPFTSLSSSSGKIYLAGGFDFVLQG